MIQEDIDPEDYHTREMYARYGLAMYFAQVVEAAIKNALVMAKLSSAEFATMDDFDAALAADFKATMGKLLERFKPFLGSDVDLVEDLQLALRLRNQLAHHFFWDHAADAATADGRDRMIAECTATVVLFQEVESRLDTVVRRYSESTGTTPEVFAARLAESTERLLSNEPRIGARYCGRCNEPMEAAGAGGRAYWQCPRCGAIALT